MKRGIKLKKVHRERWFNPDVLILFVIIILILGSVILIYFLFFDYNVCEDESCFYSGLVNCDSVSWIRYDVNADWLYQIKGVSGDGCKVEVQLLKIKKGDLELEWLEGKMMVCDVNSVGVFPEEDISKCSGKLKEDLQTIIIKRMHDYILQNLGEISEEFKRVG